MRTKTLLLTAAVIAAGVGAASAQSVYSVNAVGYVNVNIGTGFSMIANPLNTTNNTIGALFTSLPDFTALYKWNESLVQFDIFTYAFGSWLSGAETNSLNPGEGAFILNNDAPFSVTFVGEVLQGNLTNNLPANFSIRASKVPQAGLISALGLSTGFNDFDTFYKWNPTPPSPQYDIYTYAFGGWLAPGGEPSVAVGESFFLFLSTPFQWTRSFSVN